ncbi:protein phosphatase 1 regulatory subunit 1B-like isoform X1 [Phyllopteryx taeniolatus]|uniref:protein phosphatase 1 regulatory subunit 1B-like isoform X1 n=1 Tax=Phyllopteryx taeniolatus TaxID=161469 RepID=UPI002AD43BA8|nr:protein phosphatase 1 regulatory subunit 1B-like isoform X1 [Phyllopteryx taeniolatus]
MDRGPDHALFTTHTHTCARTRFLSLSVFVCLRARRTAMEPSSPKKIQFDVPPLQGHLDPQAAEHIRRRRPTPATLQIYRQPEVGDQNNTSGGSQVCTQTRSRSNLCRNLRVCQFVDGAQRKKSTLAPPTMKDLHVRVEQHSPGGPDCQLSPISAQLYDGSCPWTNQNGLDQANGNEAGLLANQERGLAQSQSSGRLESCVPEEEEEEEDIKQQNE